MPQSSCLHQDSFGQRYWMCRNYAYNPEKPKPVPKGKKGKAKMPVKWIYKEMTEFYKGMIQTWREHQKEREERQRQRAAKEKAERERREELDLREFARLNREKEERAKDQARKWPSPSPVNMFSWLADRSAPAKMVLGLGTLAPQALALRSDLAASVEPQTCNPSRWLWVRTSAPAKMALCLGISAQAKMALCLGTSAP
uniref:Uncharacterized protein n=1 Tax=Oryza barthii TaxID=65489 RepID=A0A0D3HSR9_9ORYZ